MKPGAFLFDLDGTLVDTERYWAMAISEWLAGRSVKVSADVLLPRIVGHNWFDIDRELHAMHPELGGSDPYEDAHELREHYARYANVPKTIASSVEFYKKAAKVAKCAIVSGSPRADVEAAARECGIDGITAFVLGAGDYGRGKPHPDGFLKAAGMLSVSPSECVVLEDSTVGVAAGVAAGMRVVALDRAGRGGAAYPGAELVVADLSMAEGLLE